MEEADSDESEDRATIAKRKREASKEKVGSFSRGSTSIAFNKSRGQLPRFGRRKRVED